MPVALERFSFGVCLGSSMLLCQVCRNTITGLGSCSYGTVRCPPSQDCHSGILISELSGELLLGFLHFRHWRLFGSLVYGKQNTLHSAKGSGGQRAEHGVSRCPFFCQFATPDKIVKSIVFLLLSWRNESLYGPWGKKTTQNKYVSRVACDPP